MKTLQELLRDADPVGYEPRQSDQDRRAIRRVVVESPRAVAALPRRYVAMGAVAALTLLGVAAGARFWPGADVVAAVRVEFRLAEEMPAAGLTEAVITSTGGAVYLHQEPVVTNGDIAGAHVIPGSTTSTFGVAIGFNPEGAAKMLRATQRHIGKRLAILVGGEVVTAPTLRAPVSTSAAIDGNFTRTEAENIAAGIVGR